MKNFFKSLIFGLLCSMPVLGQNFTATELVVNQHIEGTLLTPLGSETTPLVIFIAGSGPTDRDGNQSFMKNDMLKKIAVSLSNSGIATFRYDKRIVKQIRTRTIDKNISFDDFVTDAKSTIDFFKSKYETIIVAGHSQGSLVGLLALEQGASAFISLAGAGKPIDRILEEQISKTAPMLLEDSKRVLATLKAGKTTKDYPMPLAAIFNLEIQPFMANWMQYNPVELMKKQEIPTLIISGDKDLQVSIEEAQLLFEAAQNGTLLIVKNMNHVLVKIEGDDLENMKSYNTTTLQIPEEVSRSMLDFINAL
ncbi:MAG: alpha/beta hydrolase [Flavobacteriaceae bacterium]|nr:alpha/beta hydrolase [Flavobacteriaceae bacterium]